MQWYTLGILVEFKHITVYTIQIILSFLIIIKFNIFKFSKKKKLK